MRSVLADLFEDEGQARQTLAAAESLCAQYETLVLPNLERVQADALRRLLDSGGGVSLPRGSGPALQRVAVRVGVTYDLLGWAVALRSRLDAKLHGKPDIRDREAFIESFRAWCGASTARAAALLGTAVWDPAERTPFLMDARSGRTSAARAAAFRLLSSTHEQLRPACASRRCGWDAQGARLVARESDAPRWGRALLPCLEPVRSGHPAPGGSAWSPVVDWGMAAPSASACDDGSRSVRAAAGCVGTGGWVEFLSGLAAFLIL